MIFAILFGSALVKGKSVLATFSTINGLLRVERIICKDTFTLQHINHSKTNAKCKQPFAKFAKLSGKGSYKHQEEILNLSKQRWKHCDQ